MVPLFVILSSCQKRELFDERKVLIGTWDWIYSSGIPMCSTANSDTIQSTGHSSSYQIRITKKEKIHLSLNDEEQRGDPIIVSTFNEINNVEGGFSFSIYIDNPGGTLINGSIYADSMRMFGYWPEEFAGDLCQSYENVFVRVD